mmetsp:Transcript_41983/g.75323  ORF Transcript_41983/g.75323 Transcript_41983/m.75323 type:complete len:80 (-) Transcript_41983:30-269(-)
MTSHASERTDGPVTVAATGMDGAMSNPNTMLLCCIVPANSAMALTWCDEDGANWKAAKWSQNGVRKAPSRDAFCSGNHG